MPVLPLIQKQSDGSWSPCKETLDHISTITSPLSVLCCAGKSRTGKSFLLNRLADIAPGDGFGVGSTVQACTHGLWVHSDPIPSEDGSTVTLLVDTEGMDATDAEGDHDLEVMTLALLLCSRFLFNSVGHVDESAIQTLGVLTRLSEDMVPSSNSSGTNEGRSAPHLVWVLRDFALQMVDKQGKEMEKEDYLESAIRSEEGASEGKKGVRDALKKHFSGRSLFTLPRPSQDGDLPHLEFKPRSVSKPFRDKVDSLKSYLFSSPPPLKMGSKHSMTGSAFSEWCHYVCSSLTEHKIPSVVDIWTSLSEAQASNLCDEAAKEARCVQEEEVDFVAAHTHLLVEKYKLLLADASTEERVDKLRRSILPSLEARHLEMKTKESSLVEESMKRLRSKLNGTDPLSCLEDGTLLSCLKEEEGRYSKRQRVTSLLSSSVKEEAVSVWIPSLLGTIVETRKEKETASSSLDDITRKRKEMEETVRSKEEECSTLASEVETLRSEKRGWEEQEGVWKEQLLQLEQDASGEIKRLKQRLVEVEDGAKEADKVKQSAERCVTDMHSTSLKTLEAREVCHKEEVQTLKHDLTSRIHSLESELGTKTSLLERETTEKEMWRSRWEEAHTESLSLRTKLETATSLASEWEEKYSGCLSSERQYHSSLLEKERKIGEMEATVTLMKAREAIFRS